MLETNTHTPFLSVSLEHHIIYFLIHTAPKCFLIKCLLLNDIQEHHFYNLGLHFRSKVFTAFKDFNNCNISKCVSIRNYNVAQND